MFLENIRSALHALMANKQRTFLTLLGVVIGVFAVTSTISMGAIATAGITGQLEEVGSSSVQLQYNDDDITAELLSKEDADVLERLPGEVLRQREDPAIAIYKDEKTQIQAVGSSANALVANKTIKIANGRYFSQQEYDHGSHVAVLSEDLAKELFDNVDPLNKEIYLESPTTRALFTVIGVKEKVGGALGGFIDQKDAEIPLSIYHNYFDKPTKNKFYSLTVTTEDLSSNLKDLEERINSIMKRRRAEGSYTFQSIAGPLDLFNNITRILQFILGGIGAISLVVGGIGILNIMLVSVTERTREIGLRKALGAKKNTIMQQFMIEAIVLTVIGGLIGIIMAISSLYLIVALVPFLDKVILNPIMIFAAFMVSVLTGVIFGVWPANRAANLSPIEALRYE